MKYTGLEVIKILSAVEKVNFRSNETFSKFADFDSILPGSPVSEGMHGMVHQMIGDMRRMVHTFYFSANCGPVYESQKR